MKMQVKISGEGKLLLLVPGGLTGWDSWERFIPVFSKDHKVISVQLINVQYGKENIPLPEDYTVLTESRALGETLDSLEIFTPVDAVGWSYGAFTSLQYALDNPDRIRSLTLIEPPAMWIIYADGKEDKNTEDETAFFRTLKGDISEDMLAKFLVHAGFVKPGSSPRELPQWNKWINFRQALRNSLTVADYRDEIIRLKNLHIPVLLVKGTGSSLWLHRVIDLLSKYLPESKVIELPEGHGPHLVSTDKFLAELKEFQEKEVHTASKTK